MYSHSFQVQHHCCKVKTQVCNNVRHNVGANYKQNSLYYNSVQCLENLHVEVNMYRDPHEVHPITWHCTIKMILELFF